MNITEVKHHVYVKRQTRICTTWPSFPVTCSLLFIISTHILVVSRNFLSIRIALSCFYLLIFYFEKFAVYAKLKLSIGFPTSCLRKKLFRWRSFLLATMIFSLSVFYSVSPGIRRVPSASPLVPSSRINQGCLKGTRPRSTSVPGAEPMSP